MKIVPVNFTHGGLALEIVAENCAEKRLQDGTCIRAATDGTCGAIAHDALAAKA